MRNTNELPGNYDQFAIHGYAMPVPRKPSSAQFDPSEAEIDAIVDLIVGRCTSGEPYRNKPVVMSGIPHPALTRDPRTLSQTLSLTNPLREW